MQCFRTPHRRGSKILASSCLAFLLLLPAAGGCSDVDTAHWKEEIQLASGEIVIVERTSIRDKSGFPASARGIQRESTIAFPDPRAAWKSDGSMIPIAAEIKNGTVFVAANIQSREYCAKFSDPPSSVLYFRWNNGDWAQVKKDEYPQSGKANLLTNPWGLNSGQDARGLIPNKDKNLAKPYNSSVNDLLEKVLSGNWIDACAMLKRN